MKLIIVTSIILTLFSLPLIPIYGFTGRVALGLGGFEKSDSFENKNQQYLVRQYGGPLFSVTGDFDFIWFFSFFAKASLSYTNARVWYDYTSDAGEQLVDSDVKALICNFQTPVGIKFHLINMDNIRLSFGAYGIYGGIGISYDEDDYGSRHSDKVGFKDRDSSAYLGIGYSASLDIMGEKQGFRLEAEKERHRTKSFETIAGNKLTYKIIKYSISAFQTF